MFISNVRPLSLNSLLQKLEKVKIVEVAKHLFSFPISPSTLKVSHILFAEESIFSFGQGIFILYPSSILTHPLFRQTLA
jgi:hypothetical protein